MRSLKLLALMSTIMLTICPPLLGQAKSKGGNGIDLVKGLKKPSVKTLKACQDFEKENPLTYQALLRHLEEKGRDGDAVLKAIEACCALGVAAQEVPSKIGMAVSGAMKDGFICAVSAAFTAHEQATYKAKQFGAWCAWVAYGGDKQQPPPPPSPLGEPSISAAQMYDRYCYCQKVIGTAWEGDPEKKDNAKKCGDFLGTEYKKIFGS